MMRGWHKPENGGAIQSIKIAKRKEDNHDKSRNFNGQ